MPDRVIINHYKKVKELEEKLTKEVDFIIQHIDIDNLIESPETELFEIISEIKMLIEDEYIEKAAEMGIDFGKLIEKHIKKDDDLLV